MAVRLRDNGRTAKGTGWVSRRATVGYTEGSGPRATRGATASDRAAQAMQNTRAHGPMASKMDTDQKHTPMAVSKTCLIAKFLEYRQKYFSLHDHEVRISDIVLIRTIEDY